MSAARTRVEDATLARQTGEIGGARSDKLYSVAELAKELDITTRTLRFYEDRGLIAPQRVGTARIYSRRDRARMIMILRGKRLGFTLREIKDYLDLYDLDHNKRRAAPPAHARPSANASGASSSSVRRSRRRWPSCDDILTQAQSRTEIAIAGPRTEEGPGRHE